VNVQYEVQYSSYGGAHDLFTHLKRAIIVYVFQIRYNNVFKIEWLEPDPETKPNRVTAPAAPAQRLVCE
jgi:hypothetical protein